MCQHFWRRWNKEYISELQHRGRWKRSQEQLQEGVLALGTDDYTPPNDCKLGSVLSLTKGCDGVARLVTIKTRNVMTPRNSSKICPLPIEATSEDTDECEAGK
ncbi:hypothetical protein Trydic_g2992 [Trypoxylus dichotomus]